MVPNNKFNPLKPLKYPFAEQYFTTQNRMHWLPSEVSLQKDIKEYKLLNVDDQATIKSIFKFFTQSDIEVNEVYVGHVLKSDDYPEVKMMLSSFANTEAIHVQAYSRLIETLNFEDSIYKEFLLDPLIKKKYDALLEKKNRIVNNTFADEVSLLKSCLYFCVFMEGVSLFGMFSILLSYQYNKGVMQGMGQIIAWSMRDENLHVEAMSKLMVTKFKHLFTDKFIAELLFEFKECLDVERDIINSYLPQDKGLAEQVFEHMSYLLHERINNLCKLSGEQQYKNNFKKLQWVEDFCKFENVNFFHNQPTQYAKVKDEEVDLDNIQW